MLGQGKARLHLLLACFGFWALAACSHGQGPIMKQSAAENFFDGRPLELAKAIERNDIPALRTYAVGVDLAAAGRKEMTLLWYALVGMGAPNLDAVKTLISLGVDPDTQITQGLGSALDYAFLSKETQILQAMLDGGLSPNHKSPRHKLMLQRAVAASMAHTRLLVERGTNIDARDSVGGTALHTAVNVNNPEVALYLVRQGANFNTAKGNGASVAWSVYLTIRDMEPSTLRSQFEALQAEMIAKGAKFPPDPPEVVRDQMRAQGLKPSVPPGKTR